MNDFWAATLIIGSWVLLAIGVSYGRDAAKLAWTAMRTQRKTTPGYATLNAWPCDVVPVCESWLGKEISAPVIAEAMQVAEYAWYTWEPEQIEEDVDD